VQEYDKEEGGMGMWRQLQTRRFQLHNREWCSAMAAAGAGGGAAEGGAAGFAAARGVAYFSGGGGIAGQRGRAVGAAAGGAGVADSPDGSRDGNLSSTAGSPLLHLGSHGEAVAMDLSLLYGEGASGGAGRPGPIGDRMASVGGGGGGGRAGRQHNADADDDDGGGGDGIIDDDIRALMDRYMTRGGGVSGHGPATGAGAMPPSRAARASRTSADDSPVGAAAGGAGRPAGQPGVDEWETDAPDDDYEDADDGHFGVAGARQYQLHVASALAGAGVAGQRGPAPAATGSARSGGRGY
jgi:hypothetical protein